MILKIVSELNSYIVNYKKTRPKDFYIDAGENTYRGGAANFGFISITYHQYIFVLYKYILRLEISIFDRENTKNRPKLRSNLCFWDIQSGGGTTTNVGYQVIFFLSNILISPIDILIVPYDLLK